MLSNIEHTNMTGVPKLVWRLVSNIILTTNDDFDKIVLLLLWPTRTSEPLSACHTKPFWDAMTRSEISRIIEVLHHCFVNTSRTASALWAGVLEALAGTVLEGTVSGHAAPRILIYKGRETNNILSDKIPRTRRLRTLFSVSSLSLPRQRAAWQVYHWNSQKTV